MKNIFILLLLFLAGLCNAQLTNTENYIQSTTCLDADCIKKSVTVEYFDGLGRSKQIVEVKASPAGKDVVTHLEYDGFGRQVKEFLPVPQSATQNGAIIPNPLANATNPNIYGSERIYAEKRLENSPLDRLQEQKKVGNDWANKPIKYEYSANSTGEIRKYVTTTTFVDGVMHSTVKVANDTGSTNGFYKENMIYKNTAKDEDGNTTIEFLNGDDQVLLSRKILSSTENADTYYVYNEYNLLAFIIPPKASEAIKSLVAGTSIPDDVLNNFCYQYRPDGDGRVAEKKIPNKGWEYFVYDKMDRLVLTQDAVLRTANNNFTQRGWIFNKYDRFGRLLYTGFFGSSDSRSTIQTAVNSMPGNAGNYEARTTTPFNLNGMDVFYTKDAFPTSSMTLLSVNYYDVYPAYSFNPPFPTQVYGQAILTDIPNNPATLYHSTKGLHVLTLLKNIENNGWTKNYNYYDKKGRIASTHSINHLGGYTKKENDLDFTGIIQHSKTYHKRLNAENERIVTETFEYDDQNRLLVHKHQVDNNSVEILAQNDYNELSQIKNKKIGGTASATPIQSIDYKYNIQGWLTKVNNPQSLGGKLFAYEVKFTNPINTSLAPAYYNGNIAEIDWISSTSSLKRYSYQYDAIGRLKSGIYSEPNASIPENNYYNEILSYDLNGNVTTLKRTRFLENHGAQQIDDLTYTYTGNRLNTVIDSSGNYMGYPDSSGNPITYDENANMKSHVDKSILQLNYNFLNLPNYIKFNEYVVRNDPFGSGLGTKYKNTTYLYRADGIKVKKVHEYFSGRAQSDASIATDYLDGFQYTAEGTGHVFTNLQFVPTSEGYYDFIQNKYFYQYKDQVGNVRLTYYKDALGNAAVDRSTDFYPFGLEFAGELNTNNSLSPKYLYAFQGQEKQQETGWHSFKWRNYDPSFVRFFNIDPLAETYAYQSPFNFSENAVVAHRELEGLEKSYTFYTPFGNIIFTSGAAGATSSSGPGLYETAKRNATNNWNGIVRHAGYNYNILKAGGTLAIVQGMRVLNSEGDDGKAESGKEKSEGKKAPNPHGAKGKPDHQAKVKELEEKAKAENPGKDVVTEKKIKKSGSNRRPDVQVVDPQTQETEKVYEAERKPNSTRNKKREEEYKNLNIPNETHPVGNQ
ncbi:DUF6443 domain-containing protein [Pedobacter alluvionis]|uniref:RHS repeat-associated core domain-containing protein n=1 Tax=Pedobacter alluvionis TaxID=475253 RepID=A0A497Y0E0_9SPHI|nr:DUF6443 domain-containing protein [Pedobacter alluvionis]RLJ75116.1 RHS repeat-associated protein [Pedobacter alluvionis]TFB30220.1 RHS repeat-associated core domain-containing protein [Pedobacter alluvionis]